MVEILTYLWVNSFQVFYAMWDNYPNTYAIACPSTRPKKEEYGCRVRQDVVDLSFWCISPNNRPKLSSTAGSTLLLSAKLCRWPPRHVFEPGEMFFRFNAIRSAKEKMHTIEVQTGAQHSGRSFRSIFLLGDHLNFSHQQLPYSEKVLLWSAMPRLFCHGWETSTKTF